MAPSLRSKILKSLPLRARKMFTSRAALKNADDKSPVSNPFPFLQLPAELRIQIYEELAPKSESKSRNVLRVTRTHLRKDPERGKYAIERCLTNDASRHYPEILRLNRLIYHEAMPLWYGIDKLQIWIISPVIEFNIKTTLPSNLPYFLRFITSLRIDIFVENDDISSALKSGGPQTPRFWTKFGNRLAEHGTLTHLHLRFSLRTPIRLPLSTFPSHFLDILLDSYVEPFRGISGLLNLKTQIDVRHNPFYQGERNEISLGTRVYSSVEEDARAYLDTFESEMLQVTKSIH
ncbi:hypothetical protein BCIN_13g04990 [Botrytis cinerea B05.10]|uniref:Uncharacterized protein n=2 Tax=Botryotinia fuckeliana TaxID=40559 RepID=A0A384K1G3_BOTFB|nr:hypothetical protein BCIN_13g04990 [Botrytis cinerea B05.10]ATZ56665.1 hypothetical protein BCIN_13g04990 [Botrytis cinerea B05.10]CCD48200.1 hypothetical protein BofuT4_P034930.1 [Botrytis cinerea T4]